MQCNEIMTRHPKFVTLAQPIHAAATMMQEADAGFLPVCDETGVVVGTLTDRDIVTRLVANKRSSDTSISEVMTTDPITCKAMTSISDAESLLREHKISRLACVDDEGKLVGVLGMSDLAAHEDAEEMQETMQQIKGTSDGEAHPLLAN